MVASLSCEPLGFLIVSITFNKRFLFLGTVFFFLLRIWVVVLLVVFPLVPLHWPAFLLSFEVSFSSSWPPEISWIFTRYLVAFGWYCLLVLLHFFRKTIFSFSFFPSLHQPFAFGFSLLLSFCMLDHLIAIFRMFGTSNCYFSFKVETCSEIDFLNTFFITPCFFSYSRLSLPWSRKILLRSSFLQIFLIHFKICCLSYFGC